MKKRKTLAKCPCCMVDRHRTEATTCLSMLQKFERFRNSHDNSISVDTYDTLLHGDFSWACDQCLHTNKAVLANPDFQEHPFHRHLAYFDEIIVCRKCRTEFVFSKSEKRNWYEKFGFRLESRPVHCPNCRSEIRQLRAENKTLSDILSKEIKTISVSELQVIVDIYNKWENFDKVKFYESLIKKGRFKLKLSANTVTIHS